MNTHILNKSLNNVKKHKLDKLFLSIFATILSTKIAQQFFKLLAFTTMPTHNHHFHNYRFISNDWDNLI